MADDVEHLGAGKYVLVTTFRRDGTPVPTPVWAVRQGDELIIWTEAHAGKVKRIRNNGAVEVAPCNVRGKMSGPSVKGRARVLDAEESEQARRLIKSKYWVLGRAMVAGSTIRRGKDGTVGIAIQLGE
jgi:uncharacterized protein